MITLDKWMSFTTESREERGKKIAYLANQVRRIDDLHYKVQSQSCPELEYDVISTETGWYCSCPDSVYRKAQCKHSVSIRYSLELRKLVEQTKKIQEVVNPSICLYCKSAEIEKDGVRHNKYGDLQVYHCRACDHYFTLNLGFEKMRASPQAITSAMQMYFAGESLRSVQRGLLLQGVKVSHVTVMKWISKFCKLLDSYTSKLQPQVSDTWRTDELYLKMKGNKAWLYSIMCDETRLWIAQQVGDTKGIENIRPMFRDAKERAGKIPKTIISDGAQNFRMAINDEFSDLATRPNHVRDIRFDGSVHNNKMEALNGHSIRQRERVMRSLKRKDTPILKGMQIYHNFIRPHMALDDQTPAERAGIKVEGSNKWITLIQNAKVNEKSDEV